MTNEIINDLTEGTVEGLETEDIVKAVVDPDIIDDIEIKNAKTFMIAGITIVIIGTTILIVKNKDKIIEIRATRKARKVAKQIKKLEALGYLVSKKETVVVEVEDEN